MKCPRHSTGITPFKYFTDLTQFKYAFNVIQNWEMVALFDGACVLLAVCLWYMHVEGDESSHLRMAN